MAKINAVGVNGLDLSHGGIYAMPGILGCTHIGIQVEGLAAGDTLHWLHNWS